MTFTITEAAEAGARRGLPESANPRLGSRRVNPVCLEVPVSVQAAHAEADRASGDDQPAVDCMTVIVFENGAVLRLFPALPEGEAVVICNALGREARGRVVPMLNRDKLKGYVEIEFSEPVHDFWGVHQLGTRADVAPAEHREPAPAIKVEAKVAENKTPAPVARPEAVFSKRTEEPLSSSVPAASAPVAEPLAPVQNETAVVDISKVAAKAAASSASKMRTNIMRALSAVAVLLVVLGAGGYVVYKDGAVLRSLLPESLLPESLQPKPAAHVVAPPVHHAPSVAAQSTPAHPLKAPVAGAAPSLAAKPAGGAARPVSSAPRVPDGAPQAIDSVAGATAAAN